MEREEKIEELWNETIDRLLTEVKDSESSPAMVGAAIKFLKDNQIEILQETGSGLGTDYPFDVPVSKIA